MKLINKEEALFVLESNSWNIDEWNKPIELRQAGLLANDMDYRRISEIEIVEAIPIEWLLKWNKAQATRGLCNVKEMIKDWRKENETNNI